MVRSFRARIALWTDPGGAVALSGSRCVLDRLWRRIVVDAHGVDVDLADDLEAATDCVHAHTGRRKCHTIIQIRCAERSLTCVKRDSPVRIASRPIAGGISGSSTMRGPPSA